jgi:hypothetical protein
MVKLLAVEFRIFFCGFVCCNIQLDLKFWLIFDSMILINHLIFTSISTSVDRSDDPLSKDPKITIIHQ